MCIDSILVLQQIEQTFVWLNTKQYKDKYDELM